MHLLYNYFVITERQPPLPPNILAALASSSQPMLAMGAPASASAQIMSYDHRIRMAPRDLMDSGASG